MATSSTKTKLQITQDDPTITKEILSTAICKLSDSINLLLNSGLNREAIVILLKDRTGISKRSINTVIDAMGQLRVDYTHD